MYEEAIYKETNTAILNQIGQPPPSAILVALVHGLGGVPDAVAASVDWGESDTRWDVYALRSGIVTHAQGHKASSDWYGSGMHERPSAPAEVSVTVRRLTDITSISGANLEAYGGHQGFDRECRGVWTVKFTDGPDLVLDEHAKYGDKIKAFTDALQAGFFGLA